jgi:predicted transcriptional regulator
MSERLINQSVAEWLKAHPNNMVLVTAETPVCEVVKLMLESDTRDAYVMESEHVKGHLGFNKLVNYLFSQERPVHSHRQLFNRIADVSVIDIMDPHYAYCRVNEKVNDVLHRQLQHDVGDLIILDMDDSPVGVVKLTEVVWESLK